MNTMNSYKNLVELINIHESLIKTYKHNLKLICAYQIKMGYPAGYKSGTSYVDADCIRSGKSESHEEEWNKLTAEACRLGELIEQEEMILSGYRTAKEIVNNKLKGLEGIEYQVAYLKHVEGYNLQQIASKLGYNYDYIRRIFSKSHKEVTDKE